MANQLTRSPIGKFVRIAGYDQRYDERYEHVSYVPHSLPNEVDLSSETWTTLTDAQAVSR